MQSSREVGKKRKKKGREEGWGGEGREGRRRAGRGEKGRREEKRSIDFGVDGKEQIHEKTPNHH